MRYIGVFDLKGDPEGLRNVMARVAQYTEEYFGERVSFDPYLTQDGRTAIWINAAADEQSLVEWEEAMGDDSGLREAASEYLEPREAFVLDAMSDTRLARFAPMVVESLVR